jgi:hypothetical protein
MTIKWSSVKGNEYNKYNWNAGVDLDADEKFINEIISQGFTPIRVSGVCRLTFVPCQPGEFICRSAITVKDSGFFDREKAASLEALLVDGGARIIPQLNTLGSRIGVLAVRAAALGPFEINSDLDSRIAEYQARQKYLGGMGATWLALGVVYLSLGSTMEFGGWLFVALVWFALSLFYLAPASRYRKVIKRLKAERDISEV